MTIDRLTTALSDRYTIEREVGAGGMATVFLAQDIKHDRKVAIKVLRPELAAVIGAERFLSEIKTTANLQHPHILPLFDSGEADSFLFYVMPYVEGESLRDRLTQEKQLPVSEAVRITSEIGSALDYAHRHGVIHRDIKPENVMLHDGRALVADFGIALAASSAGSRMTETGMSLGTPTYMSPEQAMGERTLDARTDVYALGCVLYEMLVGDPPFLGGTAQAIVAKVMTEKPAPPSRHRDTVPEHLNDAVLTALEKLPADRFATAAEFMAALSQSVTGSTGRVASSHPPATTRWLRDPRSIALLLALAVLGAWALLGRQSSAAVPEIARKGYLFFGDSVAPAFGALHVFALSHDGRDLVYAASVSTGSSTELARKPLDQLQPTMIPGTGGARWPVFSPAGSRLLFVRTPLMVGSLETIALDGGSARTLVADSVSVGAAWGDDGYIYYSRLGTLLRIPEDGGSPDTLTTHPDSSLVNDLMPLPLPGGRAVLFGRAIGSGQAELWLIDLRSRAVRRIGDGIPLAILRDRVLLLSLDGITAQAVLFDLDRYELIGEPVQVTPSLKRSGFSIANIAFSASGSMVYWADAGSTTQVLWVDRNGGSRVIDPEWQTSVADTPRLSPDGRRLAISTRQTIEVKQLDSGPATLVVRASTGHNYLRPEWRADGRELLVYQGGAKDSVFTVRDDGVGGLTPTILDEPRGVAHATWSPDQQWVAFRTSIEGTNGADIYAQRADGTGSLLPVATSPGSDVTPVFSPDGRWLAYASDESGTFEIYLRPFPDVNGRRERVSVRGGRQPRWAEGSGELFFVSGDNQMMMVRVRTTPALDVATPEALFALSPFRVNTAFHQQYDVSADGQRFVMIGTGGSSQIVRIDNWLVDYPELTP